jgi:hypothetical protein
MYVPGRFVETRSEVLRRRPDSWQGSDAPADFVEEVLTALLRPGISLDEVAARP